MSVEILSLSAVGKRFISLRNMRTAFRKEREGEDEMISSKVEDRIRQLIADYEQIDSGVIESVPSAVDNLISQAVDDVIEIVKEDQKKIHDA